MTHPGPIATADLAVGQIISFRTLTRSWHGWQVASVDQQRVMMQVIDPRDSAAEPALTTVPLQDVLPRTLLLVVLPR